MVDWTWSPAHKCNLYGIRDVPRRSSILIHAGNLSGDVSKGYGSDVEGCVLAGLGVGEFAPGSIHASPAKPAIKQRGVTASRATLALLEADMRNKEGEQESFWLTIKEADHEKKEEVA